MEKLEFISKKKSKKSRRQKQPEVPLEEVAKKKGKKNPEDSQDKGNTRLKKKRTQVHKEKHQVKKKCCAEEVLKFHLEVFSCLVFLVTKKKTLAC